MSAMLPAIRTIRVQFTFAFSVNPVEVGVTTSIWESCKS